MTVFNRFLHDDSGATAIEYGLIAAAISIVIISALSAIGPKIQAKFEAINAAIT